MPLPILQAAAEPTSQDLVRQFYRTQLHWFRHLGEETPLDVGVAFTNPDLPQEPDANLVFDAALPPDVTPSDALAEADEHFRSRGTTCRQWVINLAAAPDRAKALTEHLAREGWSPREVHVMHLPGRAASMIRGAEVPHLTIIPARASFRHARALADQSCSPADSTQSAEAEMLHLDDPHWDALVALKDAQAIAGVGVLAAGDIGRIENLFVIPSLRRLGIGWTMMGRAMEICARSLFKHVLMGVAPDNVAALALCGKTGFRRIGTFVAYRAPG